MSQSDRPTTMISKMLCYYANTTDRIQLIRVVKDRCLDDGAVAPSSPSETRKALPSVSLAPALKDTASHNGALKDTASHNAGSHRCFNLEKIVSLGARSRFGCGRIRAAVVARRRSER